MNIEKLIERMNNHLQSLAAYSDPELAHTLEDAATALSTLQAKNKKLRANLDQVKLVRCKDCKMSRPGGLGYVWCGPTAMPLDGFCSNGQQKED